MKSKVFLTHPLLPAAMDFLEKPADLDSIIAKVKEAKAQRLVLVEKGQEENIKNILSKKGW